MSEELDALAAAAVADLDLHWGTAYIVWHTADYRFHALPKDGGDVLSSDSADGLRGLIRGDYDRRLRPGDQGSP